METKQTTRRVIAVVLAIIIFAISLMTGGIRKVIEDNKDEKFRNSMNFFNSLSETTLSGTNPAEKIAIIPVNGVITRGSMNAFSNDSFSLDSFTDNIKQIEDDPTVKALILSVNSPGGSVFISEAITKQIKKLKDSRDIPVYTVMQEMAASGGYYISAPTDRIYASNETLTGSIGVIMSSLNLKGLFDKYGIKQTNITSGKFKDMGSPGKEMTDEDREVFQKLVDGAYDRFVKVVSKGRKMSESEVKKVADGRIYDGAQALRLGLIDKIGDTDKCVSDLTKELLLTDPKVVVYQTPNPFNAFLKGSKMRSPKSELQIIEEMMKNNPQEPMYLYGE